MKVTTLNPFSPRPLPDLTLTCQLADLSLIAVPAAGGFDFWLMGRGGLDSIGLSMTGRQACQVLAWLRIEQPESVSEAREFLKQFRSKRKLDGLLS